MTDLVARRPRAVQLRRPVADAFLELAGRPDQVHRLRHAAAERVLVQPVPEDGLEDLLQLAEGELPRQELEGDLGAPDLVAQPRDDVSEDANQNARSAREPSARLAPPPSKPAGCAYR